MYVCVQTFTHADATSHLGRFRYSLAVGPHIPPSLRLHPFSLLFDAAYASL